MRRASSPPPIRHRKTESANSSYGERFFRKLLDQNGLTIGGLGDVAASASSADSRSFALLLRGRPPAPDVTGATIFAEWRAPFAACIAEAQAAGQIDTTFTPDDLAEFLLASWEGAILRMKVERSLEPLERFKRIAFATVFKEPES